MSIRALLVALAFVCAVPVATHAEPTPAPVKAFLAAQAPLRQAIDARRGALEARAGAIAGEHRACVGSRPARELATYEDFDDLQEAVAPVAGPLRAYAARLARLRTGDRVLDRAARAQARILRATLALPALDTCSARPGEVTAAVRTIRAAMNAPRVQALERDVASGARRLARLGVDPRSASFPDGALPLPR